MVKHMLYKNIFFWFKVLILFACIRVYSRFTERFGLYEKKHTKKDVLCAVACHWLCM